MDLDRESAAASLSDVARAERRTFTALSYGRSGSTLILWGVATALGYVGTQFYEAFAGQIWAAVWCIGFAGTFLLLGRSARGEAGGAGGVEWRVIAAQAALVVFGWVLIWILGPLDGRQMNAFWPLIFMLGYVFLGLWVGRFFILCGIGIGVLTVAGYWLSGPWFALWMAAVNGGALILGGLWLRRAGIRA